MTPENMDIAYTVYEESPSLTYKVDFDEEENAIDRNRITKKVDGLEAIAQMIYKTLNTNRYEFEIYNWNYGFEIDDLFGKPKEFVLPELKRRIYDALMMDDRVLNVYDFRFTAINKTDYHIAFTVETVLGALESYKDVNVRV
jgi:hypothetical protein